jgi:hypothetical protein
VGRPDYGGGALPENRGLAPGPGPGPGPGPAETPDLGGLRLGPRGRQHCGGGRGGRWRGGGAQGGGQGSAAGAGPETPGGVRGPRCGAGDEGSGLEEDEDLGLPLHPRWGSALIPRPSQRRGDRAVPMGPAVLEDAGADILMEALGALGCECRIETQRLARSLQWNEVRPSLDPCGVSPSCWPTSRTPHRGSNQERDDAQAMRPVRSQNSAAGGEYPIPREAGVGVLGAHKPGLILGSGRQIADFWREVRWRLHLPVAGAARLLRCLLLAEQL